MPQLHKHLNVSRHPIFSDTVLLFLQDKTQKFKIYVRSASTGQSRKVGEFYSKLFECEASFRFYRFRQLQAVFGETVIYVLQTASTFNRFAVGFSVFKIASSESAFWFI